MAGQKICHFVNNIAACCIRLRIYSFISKEFLQIYNLDQPPMAPRGLLIYFAPECNFRGCFFTWWWIRLFHPNNAKYVVRFRGCQLGALSVLSCDCLLKWFFVHCSPFSTSDMTFISHSLQHDNWYSISALTVVQGMLPTSSIQSCFYILFWCHLQCIS